VTLSLESSYRELDAKDGDLDVLNLRIAQSYYADDEVVTNTTNTNYEIRRSYSDIVASIDLAVDQFVFNSEIQYNPDISTITKRTNEISYKSNQRKFISLSYTNDGSKKTSKIYGSFPINDSFHLFGGLDKTTSTGVINKETTGVAYESCCWAMRLVHFKEDNGSSTETNKNYNYSTGFELLFKGLGSTSSNIGEHIESNIPNYVAKLDE